MTDAPAGTTRPLPCAACGAALDGPYRVNDWDEPFCVDHEPERWICTFCGRLSDTPADRGRPVWCARCRASAVAEQQHADTLAGHVAAWLRTQGLDLREVPPLALQDGWPWAPGPSIALGHADTERSWSGGTHPNRLRVRVTRIAVARRLPQVTFQGVAAHELGHVWLARPSALALPPWAAEGFCQYLAYRWHLTEDTPDDLWRARGIAEDADPLYGDGFRRIRRSAEAGWPALLRALANGRAPQS